MIPSHDKVWITLLVSAQLVLRILSTPVKSSAKSKNKSPSKKLRSLKRLLSFLQRRISLTKNSPSLTICHQEPLSIPPTLAKLAISNLPSFSTLSSHSEPPPIIRSAIKPFTAKDFMECVKKTEEDRKKTEDVRKQEIQLNREADLMDFRRMLNLPP